MSPQRVEIRRPRGGKIIPCNGCKIRRKCNIYNGIKKTKHYTGRLWYCDIWEPAHIGSG